MEQGNQGRLDLKLALDLSVADIFARLAADSDRPVMTGFVIGVADRRHRGQLNVVRAPVSEAEVLSLRFRRLAQPPTAGIQPARFGRTGAVSGDLRPVRSM